MTRAVLFRVFVFRAFVTNAFSISLLILLAQSFHVPFHVVVMIGGLAIQYPRFSVSGFRMSRFRDEMLSALHISFKFRCPRVDWGDNDWERMLEKRPELG